MVTNNNSLTVSVAETARQLGISRGLAYELAGRGELPGVIRLGRRFVVSKYVLENTLKGACQNFEFREVIPSKITGRRE